MESINEDSEVTTPLVVANPMTPRSRTLYTTTSMKPVILVVMLERFTYYSVLANLLLFLKFDVYQNDENASMNSSKSVLVLTGMSWLMCVGGGWMSDAKLGKLKTLIFGLVFYVIGMGLLFASAYMLKYHDNIIKQSSYRALLIYSSIMVCLVGEGAYKANISPFGAEQLSKQDESSTRRFFNYYYCSLNVGAFFAFSIVAYFQQSNGFVIGFGIPFASICLALIIFVSQRRRYKSVPSQRILGKVCQIIREARKSHRRNMRNRPSLIQAEVLWLDNAKLKHGGSYFDWEVDEVKLLFRVLPVFLVLIPYVSIYSQMQATFLEQGIHMNIDMVHFSVPAAWLNLINVIVVVTLIPVMENVVYPYLIKHGYNISPITRITFGILIACLSVVAAGFVEIFVMHDLKNDNILIQKIDDVNSTAARLSVFWQVPQYMLIGVSELFAVVAGLEFAYRNAPTSMQSIVMALYFVTNSLGSLLGFALLELSEYCHIIREKKYGYPDHTYYFFLLGVLMLLSWFAFIVYINHSVYRENKRRRPNLLRTHFFGESPLNRDISNS